jgi:hypothetical protein
VNVDDIKPGALVKVPKGADIMHRTAYLLRVYKVDSCASGAVCVQGEIRRLDGSPSTRRAPWAALTILPSRLELVAVPAAVLAPTVFGIEQALRIARFRLSVSAGRPGFHAQADGPAAVTVKHVPGIVAAESPQAETRAALALYAEALEAAGWHVEMSRHDLSVTAKS